MTWKRFNGSRAFRKWSSSKWRPINEIGRFGKMRIRASLIGKRERRGNWKRSWRSFQTCQPIVFRCIGRGSAPRSNSCSPEKMDMVLHQWIRALSIKIKIILLWKASNHLMRRAQKIRGCSDSNPLFRAMTPSSRTARVTFNQITSLNREVLLVH